MEELSRFDRLFIPILNWVYRNNTWFIEERIMLNLSQATVSIGFSIRKAAKAPNLLPNSICSGCLRGACRVDLSGVVLTKTDLSTVAYSEGGSSSDRRRAWG